MCAGPSHDFSLWSFWIVYPQRRCLDIGRAFTLSGITYDWVIPHHVSIYKENEAFVLLSALLAYPTVYIGKKLKTSLMQLAHSIILKRFPCRRYMDRVQALHRTLESPVRV